jgi:hypothetical protein
MSAKPGMEGDVDEFVPHSSRHLWPRHFQAVSLFSLAWWSRVKFLFWRQRNRVAIMFACLNSAPALIECWIRVLARGVLQPAGKMFISSMFPNLCANKGLRETAIAMLFKMDIICWQDLFSSRIVNLASSGAASLITKIVFTLFMSRWGRPQVEAVATNTWAQI